MPSSVVAKPVAITVAAKVKMPEEIFNKYGALKSGTKTAEDLMSEQLIRYVDVNPGDRIVILSGKTRNAIEDLVGGGHISSAEDLLDKIKRFGQVSFGDVVIPLNNAEKDELTKRASRNGWTVQEEIEWMLKMMKPYMFNGAM